MYVNHCHNLLLGTRVCQFTITSVKSEAFCAQMRRLMYRRHS
jgi:hypothetical protein